MDINTPVLLIGLAFLAAGILLIVKQLKSMKNNTASVMAKVSGYHTEMRHDSDGRNTVVYYPVMRYYASGKWYEKKSSVGRGSQKYGIGERVELLYDPQRPEEFIIAGDKAMLILGIIAALLGIGVCVLSFFAK